MLAITKIISLSPACSCSLSERLFSRSLIRFQQRTIYATGLIFISGNSPLIWVCCFIIPGVVVGGRPTAHHGKSDLPLDLLMLYPVINNVSVWFIGNRRMSRESNYLYA